MRGIPRINCLFNNSIMLVILLFNVDLQNFNRSDGRKLYQSWITSCTGLN
ncbi:hypothetical protein GLYMA_20G226050v4 [Glycine max]|nr:hypothetical protein GLYMA_20G226050v4 [Glycine max]KAH1037460.1 hypothetical protein GYH30_056713 [Glycine max]